MSKNLCPENYIIFENSYTIRFNEPIPAGIYTISAVIKSTDTDSSVCLMLFYYLDNSTKEVYIDRSEGDERVSKTVIFDSDISKVRVYASEGYNFSVGDTGTFSMLQIEAGEEMTDYVQYEEEVEDIPEFPEHIDLKFSGELLFYYAAWAGKNIVLVQPTCRHTMLIKKILDPSYELPFTVNENSSRGDRYLWDIINGTTEMINNTPKSDMEKYFHLMIGGSVDELPSVSKSPINYLMNYIYQVKYKKN